MKNYREISYFLLFDIFYKNQLSHIAINKIFDSNDISIEDKSIIKKEVFAIIENKILIEHIIKKYSNTKIYNIDKKILIILYIGIYEILFLDNKKDYATIDECVKIAKKQKGLFLGNFTNAILRNISSNLNLNKICNEFDLSFDIKYSIPINLFSFLNLYLNYDKNKKDKIIDIFKCFNTFTHLFLRINSTDKQIINRVKKELDDKHINNKIYSGSLVLKNQSVLVVESIGEIKNLNSFKAGLITIEDISSIYFIDNLYDNIKSNIDHTHNIKILDCCSSPGGKISGLYHLLKNNTDNIFDNIEFFSSDLTEEKIEKIKNNLNRENIFDVNVYIKDATKDDDKQYDVIICDVPCSNLGVISKKPDIKYNFKEEYIDTLKQIQYKILNNQSKHIKKNGLLSYSTCTIDICENSKIVNDFLSKNKNFMIIEEKQILTDYNNLSDGFYFAIFKRIK